MPPRGRRRKPPRWAPRLVAAFAAALAVPMIGPGTVAPVRAQQCGSETAAVPVAGTPATAPDTPAPSGAVAATAPSGLVAAPPASSRTGAAPSLGTSADVSRRPAGHAAGRGVLPSNDGIAAFAAVALALGGGWFVADNERRRKRSERHRPTSGARGVAAAQGGAA